MSNDEMSDVQTSSEQEFDFEVTEYDAVDALCWWWSAWPLF